MSEGRAIRHPRDPSEFACDVCDGKGYFMGYPDLYTTTSAEANTHLEEKMRRRKPEKMTCQTCGGTGRMPEFLARYRRAPSP